MTRDDQLELLLVEREIRNIIYIYGRAIDRGDRDLLRSLYHANAVEDHGAYKGDVEGFLDFAEANVAWAKEGISHHMTNIVIDVSGSKAIAESSFISIAARATNEKDEDVDMVIIGRYLDKFERRGGQWKMILRKVVFDSNHSFPASGVWEGPLASNFKPKGQPDGSDALYETLGIIRAGRSHLTATQTTEQ